MTDPATLPARLRAHAADGSRDFWDQAQVMLEAADAIDALLARPDDADEPDAPVWRAEWARPAATFAPHGVSGVAGSDTPDGVQEPPAGRSGGVLRMGQTAQWNGTEWGEPIGQCAPDDEVAL